MSTSPSAQELADLSRALRQPLPEVPARYFYDDRGSDLFVQITQLPEYYPTRAETEILQAVAGELAARLRPAEVAELGSGAGAKVRTLLSAARAQGTLQRCTMLDISRGALEASVAALEADYPGVEVRGIVGDFIHELSRLGPGGHRLLLFLGGTFGNLTHDAGRRFLTSVAASLSPTDTFLLGLDLIKDPAVIEAAYNDSAGVTAAFNRNMLSVLNARVGADFPVDAFAHRAFYDVALARLEMRLRAVRPVTVSIPAIDWTHDFAAGDELRTEISCKYDRPRLEALLSGTGLVLRRWHTDAQARFGLIELEPSA